MNSKQKKAAALAKSIAEKSQELSQLISSDATLDVDDKLEFVKQFIQTHIQPIIREKLMAGGHKGGFKIAVTRIEDLIHDLLKQLDQWDITGIPPESAKRLTELGLRDKQRADEQKELRQLLDDYHRYTNGSDDIDLPQLNERYHALVR